MKNIPIYSAISLLLYFASSCGKSEDTFYKLPPSAAKASDSPEEVAEVIWDLLEQRGQRNGDQLTTVINTRQPAGTVDHAWQNQH